MTGRWRATRRRRSRPPEELKKDDWAILDDVAEVAAIEKVAVSGKTLTEAEIAAMIAFLETLKDQGAIDGRLGVPGAVPSGLPVER